jgi:hypothetical protein
MPQAGRSEDWERKFAQFLDQVAKEFAKQNIPKHLHQPSFERLKYL